MCWSWKAPDTTLTTRTKKPAIAGFFYSPKALDCNAVILPLCFVTLFLSGVYPP
jgi:hypothetical protein